MLSKEKLKEMAEFAIKVENNKRRKDYKGNGHFCYNYPRPLCAGISCSQDSCPFRPQSYSDEQIIRWAREFLRPSLSITKAIPEIQTKAEWRLA